MEKININFLPILVIVGAIAGAVEGGINGLFCGLLMGLLAALFCLVGVVPFFGFTVYYFISSHFFGMLLTISPIHVTSLILLAVGTAVALFFTAITTIIVVASLHS
jgi:hypothetical protein